MRFMLESQTIKVINVDNKVQTEKEICKHGNMLPISICRYYLWYIKLRQNKRAHKFTEKSIQCTLPKRVRVLEIIATAKISILGEFISPD